MDRRRELDKQKQKEYVKYKAFQKRFENFLNIAENPDDMGRMDVEQLLNAYSKVEQMYLMRTSYRNKYYTPENWDIGHQQFIAYLVGVMNIYSNELSRRFEMIQQRQLEHQFGSLTINQKEEVQSDTDLGKIIYDIKRDVRKKTVEEEHVWKVEVPDLILKRQDVINRRRLIFMLLKRIFSKYRADITDAQTRDVIQYILRVWWIASMTHIFVNDTLDIRKLPKKPDPWDTLDEVDVETFIQSNLTSDRDKSEVLNTVLTVCKLFDDTPVYLSGLIDTVLDVTRITRKYSIYRVTYDKVLTYIPLQRDSEIYLTSVGKFVLGTEIGHDGFTIVEIGSDFGKRR